MNCREVEDRLLAYCHGETNAAERAAMEAHLGQCAGCRAEVENCREAEEALKTLGASVRAPDLRLDLRRRLEQQPRRRFAWQWAALGAAAAAALFILIFKPNAPPTAPERAASRVAQQTPAAAPPQESAAITPSPEVADSAQEPYALAKAPVLSVAPATQAPKPATVAESPGKEALVEFAAAETITTTPEPAATVAYAATPAPEEEPEALVLILGEPKASPVSSSYIAEVTLPDGARSRLGQVIRRDEAGEVTEIHIACETLLPEDNDSQGG